MTGSNRRPPACKAGALPAELILHNQVRVIMLLYFNGDPYGIRTRVTAVKGRCLNHLTNGPDHIVFLKKTRFIIPLFFTLRKYFFKKICVYKNKLLCKIKQSQNNFLPLEMGKKNGSEGRARTYDLPVNSRLLYH